MHRLITIGVIVILAFAFTSKGAEVKEEHIPEEAVRLRIIANSNLDIDQTVKTDIRNQVIDYLTPRVSGVENYQQARLIIHDEVAPIEALVKEVLDAHGLTMDYYVDYGVTHFPTKAYDGKIYQAGDYEAIYIVLGEGAGSNWWCVLFPPLCLVDDGVGEDGLENFKDVTYKFYIVEKIKELFGNK